MKPFALFDVLPIGLALSVSGLLYFALAGKYLLPNGGAGIPQRSPRTGAYFRSVYGISGELLEATVGNDSPLAGLSLHQIDELHDNAPFILGMYNGDVQKIPPSPDEKLRTTGPFWANPISSPMCSMHNTAVSPRLSFHRAHPWLGEK